MSFAFSTMFPITNDNTEYELIENDHVSLQTFQNKNILLTFCFSFTLISLRLWADPTILKFFL